MFFNKAGQRVFGYMKEEVLMKNVKILMNKTVFESDFCTDIPVRIQKHTQFIYRDICQLEKLISLEKGELSHVKGQMELSLWLGLPSSKVTHATSSYFFESETINDHGFHYFTGTLHVQDERNSGVENNSKFIVPVSSLQLQFAILDSLMDAAVIIKVTG